MLFADVYVDSLAVDQQYWKYKFLQEAIEILYSSMDRKLYSAMDLKQLNTFVHVAELGSISKASVRLRIAQPALSRQIRLLEEELKVMLFTRHGRGMLLTEMGELLFSRATSILRQVEDIRTDLTEQANAIRGKVVIGLPPTVGDILAARIATRFMSRYPEVSLKIVPAFTDYLLEWLHRGEIDIAIVDELDNPENLMVQPLLTENLFLVASKSEGLRIHHGERFKDMAKRRLVLPGSNHRLRILLEKEAVKQGVTLDVPVEADALQTLKDLARRGHAVTVLPYASIHEEVQDGKLTAAPLVEPSLSRTLVIALPLGRQTSNAVTRFSQELRA
ncbi:MAG: LysR family transcriptional regulator, partial [Sneathiella sp.]|nr:LysR family transcriptional regulator [Sneathiella sp.]